MKNKKLAIGLATTASFAILGLSAFALFTARDDSDFIAQAGNVNIEVDALSMSNHGNINPGDNDPNNPLDAVTGTDHVFEYTVTNLGNKSVRTRHTIILTAQNEDAELLDARFLAMYGNVDELITKYYVLDDDTEVTSLNDLEEDAVVKAVKYVFIGDVFDGAGKAIAEGGDAEKETLVGVVKENEDGEVERTYAYNFALLRAAGNKYQAAEFTVDVIIEAMQYRNTNEEDWETVSTVSRTFSTADVDGMFVPGRNEDANGNPLSSEFLNPEPETESPETSTEPNESEEAEDSSEVVDSSESVDSEESEESSTTPESNEQESSETSSETLGSETESSSEFEQN